MHTPRSTGGLPPWTIFPDPLALKIAAVNEGAVRPLIDGYSALVFRSAHDLVLRPDGPTIIPSGWAVAIPEGHEGRVNLIASEPLAGFRLANPPVGTVDSDYRGDVGLIVTPRTPHDARGTDGAILPAGTPFLRLEVWPHVAPPTDETSPQPVLAGRPVRGTDHAAGSDLVSLHDVTLTPGGCEWVKTGVRLDDAVSVRTSLRSRSGLAAKFGICVADTYPAFVRAHVPLEVPLQHWGKETVTLPAGTRVGQLVTTPADSRRTTIASIRQYESPASLPSAHSNRRGGYGSTGMHEG